jgi:hypothetical protein
MSFRDHPHNDFGGNRQDAQITPHKIDNFNYYIVDGPINQKTRS